MIDYVKILLTGIDINRLLNLSKLDFKVEVSEKTGEVSTKRTADYHFCKITIYDSGNVCFSGSIHKMYNSLNGIQAPRYITKLRKLQTQYLEYKSDKTLKKIDDLKEQYTGYNGNQFTLKNIIEVKEHLQQLFNCTHQQMIFQNIEFGTNTTPNFNPQLFLKGLLYHYGTPFEFRFKRTYAQAEHDKYLVKIYNKSNQYGISKHTLRVEVKLTRADQFKPLGIKTFADINTSTLNKAKRLLLKRFDEVVYYDYTINKGTLTKQQKNVLGRYSNINYWLHELKANHRFRHRKKLRFFIEDFSQNLHQKIRQEIEQKCSITPRQFKDQKCSITPTSNIGGIIQHKPPQKPPLKKCIITGINLGLEKAGSYYIKTTTLRHLKNNDKLQFEMLVSMLMSNCKVKPKYEQSLISHLAKQIRNKLYNSNKTKQQGYKQKKYNNINQLQLFNFKPSTGGYVKSDKNKTVSNIRKELYKETDGIEPITGMIIK